MNESFRRCAAAALMLSTLAVFAALCGLAHGAAPGNEVAVADLPKEVRDTLAAVKAGGPFKYPQDGVVFGNRERLLPEKGRGYYREYTAPTPGARNRGARRIVAGAGREYWYTEDHYNSFRRIRE